MGSRAMRKVFALGVVEHEGEDAVQAIEKFPRSAFIVKVEEHLAVRRGLEVVGLS